MTQMVVFEYDTHITLLFPSFQDSARPENDTDEAFLQRLIQQVSQDYPPVNYHILPLDSLPPCYEDFKAARTLVNGRIEIDLDKAKEVQKNRWRQLRKPLLQALDVEYDKADELGDLSLKQLIAQQKQALRDVTLTDLSQVETPEELVQFIPEILRDVDRV